MDGDFEPVLRVFSLRSEYEPKPGVVEVFHEGPSTDESSLRYKAIESWFEKGGLRNLITDVSTCPSRIKVSDPVVRAQLDALVDSVTSERGRAVVGLVVLQLAIKTACPDQSVRLHKASKKISKDGFSWSEGVSMRSLDRNYVTPFLREQQLLRLNADGFMMTRSLAENYPYTNLYKAAIRGARNEWLSLVDTIEREGSQPEQMLKYLLSLLLNRSEAFSSLASAAIQEVGKWLDRRELGLIQATDWMMEVVKNSEYSARVFEIAMHSLYQALDSLKKLPYPLKPLSQMRSANKKHRNVGDIELSHRSMSRTIVEAWDAKFAKPYLRDELEELHDKLSDHPETEIAGFVTSQEPDLCLDVRSRISDLEAIHDVSIKILDFRSWVTESSVRFNADEKSLAKQWIRCFVESLAQRRRDVAPIDEPCEAWLRAVQRMVDCG